MKLTFDDGVALVSGGSGGIGSAIVSSLAESGVPVAFTYNRGKQVADELMRAAGVGPNRVTGYRWSGSGFREAAELVRRVTDEMGPIRYLVAAAGRAQEAAFHTLTEDHAKELIDTNLTSVIGLARAVATPMMKSGSGRIVFIGSVSGSRGIKGHTVYAATKAALEGLTRSLAREAGPFGVTVNCVAPGLVETPMTESMPAAARKGWLDRIPLGRPCRPGEVARSVGFLLSREAAYVNGQTLTIDGGLSA